MKTYKITLASDHTEINQFCNWLTHQGHDVEIGDGNYIDGEWTSSDIAANKIMNDLWGEYCNSHPCSIGHHEYSEKECPACGYIFCFSCSGFTDVDQGGKYNPYFMTCPQCGLDYYEHKTD